MNRNALFGILQLMSENELVRKCLKGNLQAQKQLYIQYAPQMKGICVRYSSSIEEAEDMLQEAFIRVFTKMHTFKFDGPLGAWIRRVVVNTSAEIYRREKKHSYTSELNDYTFGMRANDNVIEQLAAEDLLNKIQQLPDGYRVVFNLYAIEGYSHKEIGEKLNISENTSKSQYSRARASIRQMIEDDRRYSEKVG